MDGGLALLGHPGRPWPWLGHGRSSGAQPTQFPSTARRQRRNPIRETGFSSRGRLPVRAYVDKPNPGFISQWASKIQNSLPVVGLLSQLMNPEGNAVTDWLRYPEFCRVVEKNITKDVVTKMELLESRYGRMARPQIFLFWCWIAAVGAGLVKSDDILIAAKRLRISMDLEFELSNFDLIIGESFQKRSKAKSAPPSIPMDLRIEKALEAISLCCLGSEYLNPNDAELLLPVLHAIFPSVEKPDLQNVIQSRLPPEESNE